MKTFLGIILFLNLNRFNKVYICELLQHLKEEDDPEYQECSVALKIAFYHCLHMDKLKMVKPFQMEIAERFGIDNVNERYIDIFDNLLSICVEYINNGRSDGFVKNISSVQPYIDYYKESIIKGYEEAKNDLIAAKEINNIYNDQDSVIAAYKNIVYSIVYNMVNTNQVILEEDILFFLEKFYYGVARMCKIIMKDPTATKFGTNIIDAIICLSIGKNDNRIIVSNDGKKKEGLLTTFKYHGVYNERAKCADDYFKSIDFEVI